MTYHLRKIVLCSTCEGWGFTTYHQTPDYHRGEYDVIEKFCKSCNGKGRKIELTKTDYELLRD